VVRRAQRESALQCVRVFDAIDSNLRSERGKEFICVKDLTRSERPADIRCKSQDPLTGRDHKRSRNRVNVLPATSRLTP
jgi:hypothetical protein